MSSAADNAAEPVSGPTPAAPLVGAGESSRLLSLDVLRGMTIAGMILVNNPGTWGSIYGPLEHAPWDGCTPTDLVFPFFLFMVGVAMTLSFDKRLARGASRARMFGHVVARSAVLILLGWDFRTF
jgi:predicted acyltransferase